MENYESKIFDYMYKYLYQCNIQNDRDCYESWDDGMNTDTLINNLKKSINENRENIIKEYGMDVYNNLTEYEISDGDDMYSFCTFNNEMKEKCVNYKYTDDCATNTTDQLLKIINKEKTIFREICFKNTDDVNEFLKQIKDHQNKSIYNGKLSDLGIYWSWNKETSSFWGRSDKKGKCVILEGIINDPIDIDIENSYSINQIFGCREKEIRLNKGSRVNIIKIHEKRRFK